eukprot:618645-Alexandrium_andersonii.AAC.1
MSRSMVDRAVRGPAPNTDPPQSVPPADSSGGQAAQSASEAQQSGAATAQAAQQGVRSRGRSRTRRSSRNPGG